MDYIFKEYIDPINIKSGIRFIKLSEVSNNHINELAKMYCTLFNSDNTNLLKLLDIAGRTNKEGLWSNEPYTYEVCTDIITDYMSENYFGVVALGKAENKDLLIGASIYQIRSLAKIQENVGIIPFKVPEDTEVWCEIDTFRREVTLDGNKVKYLSNKMRFYVLKMYKGNKQVLIYSSTNNPVMLKSWKKDGFTIANKPTSFGNNYQVFKLIY
ncbi:hypothetical protein C4561_02825 [candidate division WWE3 bacterium]|uniref:Uncharacterized protein n=1 Tax=candidate division WWE3 bacterium TaxID=2053526 RepID=A0A3A4ZDI8_UNCKA|nr:MAG: hypothetical protein C4561_02825 [candidate division WWE3 bacterium]